MKYNIYDKDNNWLGCVMANSPEQAIEVAKREGMPTASFAEERSSGREDM